MFQQRPITWGFQAWGGGGQQQRSVSAVWLELRAIERGRNLCALARMHAARAAPSSYAAAPSRLLPTSVSTNCFQETGWERKRAPTENPWVKNMFLQLLDYFVLERREREIIKQPRCIPALALGTPMLCYPRAPSFLPGPSCPMLLWEHKHLLWGCSSAAACCSRSRPACSRLWGLGLPSRPHHAASQAGSSFPGPQLTANAALAPQPAVALGPRAELSTQRVVVTLRWGGRGH